MERVDLVVKCVGRHVKEVMKDLKDIGFEKDEYAPTGVVAGAIIFIGSVDEDKVSQIKAMPYVINAVVDEGSGEVLI